MNQLKFQQLREANVERLSSSKYKLCESTWQPAHWMNALTGEVGEAANFIKKVDRGDMSMDEARPHIAKEIADIQCYLDILAFKLGVDLGQATVDKFNEVSLRIGSDVRLPSGPTRNPDQPRCIAKLRFCHAIEDSWWYLHMPDGSALTSTEWVGLKAKALEAWPDVEFVWDERNSSVDDWRRPGDVRPSYLK